MSRNSFILHNDSLLIFDELTDEQAGKLFKAIKKYNQTGEITELDFALKLALVPFLNQFKRDQEKWVEECKKSSDKGKLGNLKRWHPDLYLQVEQELLTIDEAISITKDRPPIIPDPTQSIPIPKSLKSDSKSDSVNDSDKEKNIKKEICQEEFETFWNLYDYKKGLPKTKIAFEKSLKKDSFENILAGVNAYIQSRGTDKQYWKHPTTWLNAEAWKDEYIKAIKTENDICLELNKLVGSEWFKEIEVVDEKAIFSISKANYELLKALDQSLKDEISDKIKTELQVSTIRPKYL